VRFVHVTDSHIAPDAAFTSYGHAPYANLVSVVDAINALPFPIDFVLHTGDVVQDRSEAAYRLAAAVLARLRLPIHYVAGNHDDADILQHVLLHRAPAGPRFDYRLDIDGIQLAVFDSRGPHDPSGRLTHEQLSGLRRLCSTQGPPLVIAIHHPPVALDTKWLDEGWTVPSGRVPHMLLERGREFQDAVAPARERLRGVFFGHVHRAFQVMQRGVLYSSASSSFGQLLTWHGQEEPEPSPQEPAGFSVVTITIDRTIVRQYSLPRPARP
jgi:3',5'-cyclic AMP phosphodiesterase CpdA